MATTEPLARYGAAFEDATRRVVALVPEPRLRAMVEYHLGWVDPSGAPAIVPSGKKLRPSLCLATCEAAGGDPTVAIGAAAAIELIHNFSLVHDDVQDRGATRHHRETVWRIWGEGQAINAGDALFALAHLALIECWDGRPDAAIMLEVFRRLDRCCLELVSGQTLDLAHERQLDLSIADYLAMIQGKTSAIIATSAEVGALVAGAEAGRVAAFGQFSRLLGTAFQIVDDMLGIWGDEGVTGKSQSGDVARQKVTLPVLDALQSATAADQATLRVIYGGALPTSEQVQAAIAIFDRAGVRERSSAMAEEFLADALAALSAARPIGDDLARLALRLVRREA